MVMNIHSNGQAVDRSVYDRGKLIESVSQTCTNLSKTYNWLCIIVEFRQWDECPNKKEDLIEKGVGKEI